MCQRCRRATSTYLYLGLIFLSVAIAGILKYAVAPALVQAALTSSNTPPSSSFLDNTSFIDGPAGKKQFFYAISDCAQRVDDWSTNNTVVLSNTTTHFTETEMLAKCIGNYFVFRVSFVLSVMFILFSIITACDPLFHNGQWPTKMFLYFLLLIGSFFIPNDFFYAYSYVSRIGSLLFILLQMVIMVDFAFDWHEDFLIKIEKCENQEGEANDDGTHVRICCCSCGLAGVQAIFLIVSFVHVLFGVVGSALLYVYYQGCDENVAIITLTLLCGIIITVTGPIQCKGKKDQQDADQDDGSIGLLVPSMVFCYCVYYAFDSVKANPNPQCHPGALPKTSDDAGAIILGLIVSAYSLSWVSLRTAQSARGVIQTRRTSDADTLPSTSRPKKTKKKRTSKKRNKPSTNNQIEQNSDDEENGSVQNTTTEDGRPATSSNGIGVMEIGNASAMSTTTEGREELSAETRKDDHDTINKQIWLFHFILGMGAFYLGMILTQWGGYTGMTAEENEANQATSLWVNAIGGWVAYAIFAWIRVAPMICEIVILGITGTSQFAHCCVYCNA